MYTKFCFIAGSTFLYIVYRQDKTNQDEIDIKSVY